MKITRRELLKRAGIIAGLAALGGVLSEVPLIANEIAKLKSGVRSSPLGEEKIIPSTCAHCVNFCGIKVKVIDGVIRAVYPDENRAEYFNWGICPKGVAGIFNTYNPYRIKAPLKRTNPEKGPGVDPKWVEISWEEAFNIITEKLKKIRSEDPRKLIWQHGHGKYLISDKFPKAFAKAFGTPNVIHRTTVCEAARHVADEITWGYHEILPDLEYCKLLLNFGANYFEAEQWARWLDHTLTIAKEKGLKLIVIEPRLSNLAAKADEWVPIRPGKDIIFLLAMANVLIQEGYVDEEFLINYTNAPFLVGEDSKFLRDEKGNPLVWDENSESARPYSEGVKPALSGEYEVNGKKYKTAFQVFKDSIRDITPEYAEKVCGVPADTIRRIAIEFGKEARIGSIIEIDGVKLRYRPVAIHAFRGLIAKEYGVQNWRAGLIIQMIVGNIDAVGGLILHSPYKKPKLMEPSKCEYPPSRVDLQGSVYFPHATHNVAQQVALTLINPKAYGLEYEPEMQIVYGTNRLFSTCNTSRQIEGYKKLFTVCIDIVMSEMAEMADIVLPDLTYLESWHFSSTRWTPGTRHSAIRQPVIANVYNIPYDAYMIIWELVKRLGLRDEYIEELNKQWGLKNVKFEKGRDYSPREALEVIWKDKTGKDFEYAMKYAFVGKKLSIEDRYLKGVEVKFKGPGKPKMHLYCEELIITAERIKEKVKEFGITNIDVSDLDITYSPIPRKEHAFPTPHREAKEYEFYLITYKRMYRYQSGNTALNPILNEVAHDANENFVLINTKVAEKKGIKDGDLVIVESRIGKVKAKARLSEGIRPDTVAISYHYGHWSLGFPDYAKKGTHVNEILESHPDKISGEDSFNDTKVRIYKS